MIKMASWNVNSLRVRLNHVLEWADSAQPDILCLQETKCIDEAFPEEEICDAGYYVSFAGQPTYNGVAIISKTPVEGVVKQIPGFEDEQVRVLTATVRDIRIMNVYVPNGAAVDTDKYQYKLAWLEALTGYIQDELQAHPNFAVMGDFNIAPADADVYDPELWRDKVLVSPPERAAFEGLCALGLRDSFRLFEQTPEQYSWWDFRTRAFAGNRGLRIDHILISEPLASRCESASIDPGPRGWDRPSDHTPVVATVRD